MKFVLYGGKVAAVIKDGAELSAEAQGELDDHLGLWFGEVHEDGRPIIRTIPADYVDACPTLAPHYQH